MIGEIRIEAGERDTVRVFAVNLPPDEAEVWESDEAQDAGVIVDALGAEKLDHAYVDVINVDAMHDLGLSTFLIDGLGLPEKVIEADKARLDALSGYVVVLSSLAFGGIAQTLKPKAVVTLIGTYREPPETPTFEPLQSQAAVGSLEPPSPPRPTRPPIRIPWGAAMAVLAVGGLALLALLLR